MVRPQVPLLAEVADKAVGSASEMELDPLNDLNDPTRPQRKIFEVEHESLSQNDVEKLMRADIEYISSIFGVEVSSLEACMPLHVSTIFTADGYSVSDAAVDKLEQGEAY